MKFIKVFFVAYVKTEGQKSDLPNDVSIAIGSPPRPLSAVIAQNNCDKFVSISYVKIVLF